MNSAPLASPPAKSEHLHHTLRDRLRETLQQQGAGQRVASERALAREFGVSTSTVSRALQDLEREGLLRRIPGKGTFIADAVSRAARVEQGESGLRPGNAMWSGNLAPAGGAPQSHQEAVPEHRGLRAWIIVQLENYEADMDRASDSWPPRCVSRLEYAIAELGGTTRITLGHSLTEAECAQTWQETLAQGVDCVFFIANERNPLIGIWSELFLSSHFANGTGPNASRPVIIQIPFASVTSGAFDTVSYDGQWGVAAATHHLLELGHRDIAFLASDYEYSWLAPRLQAFHGVLRAHGIPAPRDDAEFGVLRIPQGEGSPFMWQEMGRRAAALLVQTGTYTAALATNDQMAAGLIEELERMGKDVPGDYSIVGFDDRFFSSVQGLTTVRTPVDEIADASLSLARRRLAETGFREHQHLVLKPRLMVRRTTRELG